jgi:uncharacterized surface protein with fasciclin (FAS1) repeats
MRKLTYALIAVSNTDRRQRGLRRRYRNGRRPKHVPSKDIIDNAVNSADHTTLVAALKAAGLIDTLKGKGPFTVFARTNAAFAKLPAGTVGTLLKPENKVTLTKILTYHVVPRVLRLSRVGKRNQEGRRQS